MAVMQATIPPSTARSPMIANQSVALYGSGLERFQSLKSESFARLQSATRPSLLAEHAEDISKEYEFEALPMRTVGYVTAQLVHNGDLPPMVYDGDDD